MFVGTAEGLYCAEGASYGGITDLDLATDPGSASMPRVEEPRYFVCTNGQRDLCCARYGLPAYARLRELVGERAWQTTHVGGHRFAPNVLTLPQGVLYGRVRPEDVPRFVEDVEAGRLARDHVRGRSAFPAEAQAAETALDEEVLELVRCEAGRVVMRTPHGRTPHTRDAGRPDGDHCQLRRRNDRVRAAYQRGARGLAWKYASGDGGRAGTSSRVSARGRFPG